MAAPRTHYEILNVSPLAEPVVIEAAYRALIKKYHPDQAAGVTVSNDAAAINEAWATLKDPARRADYDHRLWTKQQALRLAGLQAPQARVPRFAAWGGWLVAGLLACAVAAMAVGKSLAPPPLAAIAEAAAPAGADDEPARASAVRAAAAESAKDRLVLPSSASVIASVRAEREVAEILPLETAPLAAVPPPEAEPVARVPLRERRVAPAPPAPARRAKDKDFLEREGYIY